MAQNAPHVIIPAVPQVEWRNSMDIPVMPLQMYSSALGVQTENLTRQLGEFFGVKDGEGVLVRSVEKGSAGEKAGLKAGDVIVKADNEKLTDRTDLTHILRNHRTGGKVTLVVMRDKHEQTFTVTLPDRSSRDSSYLDLDTEDLQASLGSIPEVFSNLSDDVQVLSLDDLSSLGDSLAILNNGKALLDLQNLPAVKDSLKQTQRELQHMQKQLQELHISSDPI
ncbi:MAG TPA: PDZ domain-containing protein [Candidatus Angelobacter sp.]|nr:PDZ domain-containing protein [Candidatus Angelobacter sp.]